MLTIHNFARGAVADISVAPMLGICRGVLSLTLPGTLDAYQQRMRARPAYERAQVRCRGEAPAEAAPRS